MKPELSYLAHNLCEIDKYRVETCCVIGESQPFYVFLLRHLQAWEAILVIAVKMMTWQSHQKHLVNVISGSLKSRANGSTTFPTFSFERAAVILLELKVVKKTL